MFEKKIDHESFDIAVAAKDEVIECLESKVAWLERELDMQRKRADLALDRLLSKLSCPTVMPENIVFPKEHDLKAVSEHQKVMEAMRSEIEQIGEIADEAVDQTHVEEIQ